LRPLRIGTRASALAQWQAEHVRAALAAAGVAAELVLVRTTGDRERQASLRVIGGKGVFVKELEEALTAERVDLAVHSMKDLPTEQPAGLAISAICRRHDVRDALVSHSGAGLDQLPAGARVGTSSLRRQAQLRNYFGNDRADIQLVDIRGNVDTRVAKAERGDYDAVVLAKAGLDRLGLAERISDDAQARTKLRELFWSKAVVKSKVAFEKEEPAAKFKDYFNWSEPVAKIPSHRMLAIRRGETEGLLMMRIQPPEEEALALIEPLFVTRKGPAAEQVRLAVQDGYKRLLGQTIEVEIRLESKKRADTEAIRVFSENLRELLLSSPLGRKNVLAIDPGFRTGCKVVCLDRQGKLLHNTSSTQQPPHPARRAKPRKQCSG